MSDTIKRYFRENLLLWAGMALIIFIMSLFLFENGQIEAHLMINSFHEDWADVVLRYLTYVGGGLPCYFALGFMIFRFRSGLYILLTQGLAALITQPLKYGIGRARPLTMWTEWSRSEFASDTTLFDYFNAYMTQWIERADAIGFSIPGGYNSFPSGHTSAVFAFMASLAAILPPKYKTWQIAFLLIGVSVAYSRIYLSCHFLEDTLSGALIGAVSAMIMYVIMYRSEWGDKPLYKLSEKK